MGIKLRGKHRVEFRQSNQEFLITDPKMGLDVQKFGGFTNYGLFTRRREISGAQKATKSKDGNPLLYCMKSSDGLCDPFILSKISRQKACAAAGAMILANAEKLYAGHIMVAPSSSDLADDLAHLLSSITGATVLPWTFNKATNRQVRQELRNMNPKSGSHEKKLLRWLESLSAAQLNEAAQAKYIHRAVLPQITMYRMSKRAARLNGIEVVIVDDAFTTGNSMAELSRLVEVCGGRVSHGVTLFGPPRSKP